MARQQNKTTTENGGIQQYTKLEHRLVLLAWLNSLLGYGSNKEMLADTKNAAEGFDAEGHSFLYHHLRGRGGKVKIPVEDLERYDDNIHNYLNKMYFWHALPKNWYELDYLTFLEQRRKLIADIIRRGFLCLKESQ